MLATLAGRQQIVLLDGKQLGGFVSERPDFWRRFVGLRRNIPGEYEDNVTRFYAALENLSGPGKPLPVGWRWSAGQVRREL